MNTHNSCLFLLSFFFNSLVFSQVNQQQMNNTPAFSDGVGLGETFVTNRPFVKDVVGSPYLFSDWESGSFIVKTRDVSYSSDKINYNIKTDILEIEINDEIRSMNGLNVSSFKTDNGRSFYSCFRYKNTNTSLPGFFEVLYDGEKQLLERAYIYIKPATYNTALMIGAENDEILIKSEFYYLDNKKGLVQIKKFKDIKMLSKTKNKSKINRQELIEFFSLNQL